MNFPPSREADRRPHDGRLIEGVVANLALFRQSAPRDRAEVASYSRLQSARRGARVCAYGQPMPGLMVLAYGMLKLALPRNGRDGRVLRFVGAGETFGEAPAFAGQPSPYDATALADSMLVIIPRRAVLRLIERQPAFAQGIVSCLADGYLALLAEIQASAHSRGVQRLASYLVSLAEPNGDPGSWTAHLPVSKTAIAARLGVSKETLSRMLRLLSERGLISVSRRDITLLDKDRLAQAAL
jgi:CRP-like cAMP-binding protein